MYAVKTFLSSLSLFPLGICLSRRFVVMCAIVLGIYAALLTWVLAPKKFLVTDAVKWDIRAW